MKPGDKIKMDGEAQRYTVMACDSNFAIMTKPFNARRTYLYTITDLARKERGPCNLIFGLPCHVNTETGAAEAMAMLVSGEMAVSHRRSKPLSAAELAQLANPS